MNLIDLQNNIQYSSQGVIFIVFIFVLVAEMGDKTQLLVMAMATKYKFRQVFIGIFISIIALNIIAVAMGKLVCSILPMNIIHLFASVLFILFGVLSFYKDDENNDKQKSIRLGPILTIAITFFIAELGDKTQLATMTFAARYNSMFQVFLGAVLGMVAADMIGIIGGTILNKYIPKKYIKSFAGFIFIGFGVYGLLSSIPNESIAPIINTFVILVGLVALLVIYLLYRNQNITKKSAKD